MKKRGFRRLTVWVTLTALLAIALSGAFTAAAADTSLSVYVETGGERTLIKTYGDGELASLPQTQAFYSSIDATACPVVIAAEGVTPGAIMDALGIPSGDAVTLRLQSSDGWSRSFSASEYLNAAKYYYSGIVDGYVNEADEPPQFAEGTDAVFETVPAILALRSYEGRFEANPDMGAADSSSGIRFCFGQNSITDTPLLNYGKYINSMTIVLSDSTGYIPPADPSPSPSPSEDPSPSPSGGQGEEEEIENEGLTADTLTITVGYYGGTYYTKKVFTLDELSSMAQVTQVYSYIDNMPAVCLDSAVGVKLTDVLAAAGVDVNSIHSFNFYCADVARTWYMSMTKSWLLDTVRYYYPALPTHWDYDESEPTSGATEGALRVPAIIALTDNWRRFATEEGFDNMTSSTRFRILYGQSDPYTVTGSQSAKWIHTIAVTLIGTAPKGITMDASALELEIGSKYQLKANIEQNGETTDNRVTWQSSDESVVKVDSNGKITVVGEGSATVTVTTVVGGLSASVQVNGSSETPSPSASPAPSTQPSPSPSGSGDAQPSRPGQSDTAAPTPDSGMYEITGEGGTVETVEPPSGLSEQSSQRVFALSEAETVLADMDTDNPLSGATLCAGIFLFCGGAAAEVVVFYKKL